MYTDSSVLAHVYAFGDTIVQFFLWCWTEFQTWRNGSWETIYQSTVTFTSALTFLIGLAAGITAFISYRTNRGNQQFQNATHTYRKYLELAVDWPQLAEPNEHAAMLTAPLELSRYEWFVGILLRACEELLEYIDTLAKTDRTRRDEWCRTVKSQLEFHERYFRENQWFKTEANQVYSNRLLRVINEVVREHEEKERRKTSGARLSA